MKLIDPHLRGVKFRERNYAADEPMHPIQIAGYRKMTVAQKLDRLSALYCSARAMMATGVRMRHPDWNDEQVEREVREAVPYGVS